MAEENENGQEKTEDPTPKRRKDAKEKGQVPRSRELNTTLAMLAAAGSLIVFGHHMFEGLTSMLEQVIRHAGRFAFDPNAPVRLLHTAIGDGLLTVLPFVLVMFVVSLVAPVALGGWSFSGKSMAPKFEKINPLKGLKRIFGTSGLVELGKALAKVVLVGVIGAGMLWMQRDDFRTLAGESLRSGMAHAAHVFFGTFFVLAASMILIALIDVPYQLWSHNKKLKMTLQEVKDEMKDTEGKPEVKGRIRQLQQQMAQGRMMEQVPTADVVVTNPTHFAVALKYDQIHMRAPKLVAKGTDLTAQRIRELAREHRVPLFEAPPLARALYHTTDLDREIPAGLYLAVAQILAYIYQLRRAGPGRARPARPQPEVPEEFLEYANQGRRTRR
ncbi:MAG TPA: flagellar biosynthesis protein FlhB [Gammaproteobacteria bacterium]|nr:flagellar biosynthesis protein FlhB [Gammaproteobacteria bacterium]